jgi:RNA polymerase sigma-70 factor (ECF subfamily)
MADRPLPHLYLIETLPEIDTGSDGELVARAKGDVHAFSALYRRYVGPVYGYCFRRVGTRQAAEDLTGDIFLKAFAGIRTCRDDQSFRSWLFTIAYHAVTDSYRERRPDQSIDLAAAMADAAPGPEDQALLSEGSRSVAALLARLTDQQARIIELRLSGLTGPEIARVLDCSLASVKIGLVRGYSRLRVLLGSREDTEVHGGR